MNRVKGIVSGLAALCLLIGISCTDDPAGPGAGPDPIINPGTMKDRDGNVYKTVKIGEQEWMAENLKTTKYNDGTPIVHVADSVAWYNLSQMGSTTGAYCYYENSPSNMAKYGTLYNWYVVSPANPKKIASPGWHVPTDAEWTILENYLVVNGFNWDGTRDTSESNKIAKALAAKTDWDTKEFPSEGDIGYDLALNNHSGFSALPGAARFNDGDFYGKELSCYLWSATEEDAFYAWYRYLWYDNDYLTRGCYGNTYIDKSCGFSVRLVRD